MLALMVPHWNVGAGVQTRMAWVLRQVVPASNADFLRERLPNAQVKPPVRGEGVDCGREVRVIGLLYCPDRWRELNAQSVEVVYPWISRPQLDS